MLAPQAKADCDDDEVELKGTIQSLPATSGYFGDWVISGRTVRVTSGTEIERENNAQTAIGAVVEVEGCPQNDNSILAKKIKIKPAGNGGGEFIGTIESLPSTAGRIGPWSVGGRKINVTGATRFSPATGSVAIGYAVKVQGAARADGSIDAVEIEIRSSGGSGGSAVEFSGTIETLPGTAGQFGLWTVSGRRVHVVAGTRIENENGPAAIGSSAEVKGAVAADGIVTASKIEVKNRGVLAEFFGRIESLPAAATLIGVWQVGGRAIRVTAATSIERKYGTATLGAYVKASGLVQTDGAIQATRIEVKQGEAGGGYANFNPVTTVSAASYLEANAPEGIVSAFGAGMSSVTVAATQLPLPTSIDNVTVLVDGRQARLFFVSPGQINYQLPPDTPAGVANVVVARSGRTILQGTVPVSGVSPGMFTANASGDGAPAGVLLRVRANGQQAYESLVRFDAAQSRLVPAPIIRRVGEQLFLILYGTGLKLAPNADGNAANGVAESVQVAISGINAPVIFAGAAPGFVGLEQINIRIPDNAPPNPAAQVLIRVRDGFNNLKAANAVAISLQ
jgi:uncharacterized protein (TIGR03437 family)